MELELELKKENTMSRRTLPRAFARSRTSSPRVRHHPRARSDALRRKVPDEVALKIEFEVEDDETEFKIDLTWQPARRTCAPPFSGCGTSVIIAAVDESCSTRGRIVRGYPRRALTARADAQSRAAAEGSVEAGRGLCGQLD